MKRLTAKSLPPSLSFFRGRPAVTAAAGAASISIAALALLILWQPPQAFADPDCASYDGGSETIEVECDATLDEVMEGVDDDDILQSADDEGWILGASILVEDGATLTIGPSDADVDDEEDGDGSGSDDEDGDSNSNDDSDSNDRDNGNGSSNNNNDDSDNDNNADDDGSSRAWLKITGDNGIIVEGMLEIDGTKLTSWDEEAGEVVEQEGDGSVARAYIQIAASDGVVVTDSEFGYLGYNDPGRRGFDVFGPEPSHNIEIRDSEFHHMWMAFYSREAYDILIEGNEYHDNVKYALDPHTGTHDVEIRGNHLHDNPVGVICSLDCYNILIEGNEIHDNKVAGVFLSRNMHDSVVRENEIYNERIGVLVSESPDNEIYNNTIEASLRGISLSNPQDPDDGETEGNVIEGNSITGAEYGIAAISSQDNVLQDNEFSEIDSSEYYMTGGSSIQITDQDFDDAKITGESGENEVEISDSGIIEVEEDDEEDGDEHDTGESAYSKSLSGDTITVNSE